MKEDVYFTKDRGDIKSQPLDYAGQLIVEIYVGNKVYYCKYLCLFYCNENNATPTMWQASRNRKTTS